MNYAKAFLLSTLLVTTNVFSKADLAQQTKQVLQETIFEFLASEEGKPAAYTAQAAYCLLLNPEQLFSALYTGIGTISEEESDHFITAQTLSKAIAALSKQTAPALEQATKNIIAANINIYAQELSFLAQAMDESSTDAIKTDSKCTLLEFSQCIKFKNSTAQLREKQPYIALDLLRNTLQETNMLANCPTGSKLANIFFSKTDKYLSLQDYRVKKAPSKELMHKLVNHEEIKIILKNMITSLLTYGSKFATISGINTNQVNNTINLLDQKLDVIIEKTLNAYLTDTDITNILTFAQTNAFKKLQINKDAIAQKTTKNLALKIGANKTTKNTPGAYGSKK